MSAPILNLLKLDRLDVFRSANPGLNEVSHVCRGGWREILFQTGSGGSLTAIVVTLVDVDLVVASIGGDWVGQAVERVQRIRAAKRQAGYPGY